MGRRSILRRVLIDLAVVCILAVYILWGNTSIGVTHISVDAPGLPEEFDRFRIVQVSDLHNAEFGEENSRLLSRIADCDPDLIVLTGDLIDSQRTDVNIAVRFAAQAAAIAPTYFIQGNHDAHDKEVYGQLKSELLRFGVTVLENETVSLTRGDARITLAGLLDYGKLSESDSLTNLSARFSGYTILLSHRPEYFGHYAGAGADLVFSGHAHGGQFRLPLIGGLYAPGQGVFPSYDAGLYVMGDTQMIVSRGLGNSSFPFRLNNRPELIAAELTALPE